MTEKEIRKFLGKEYDTLGIRNIEGTGGKVVFIASRKCTYENEGHLDSEYFCIENGKLKQLNVYEYCGVK